MAIHGHELLNLICDALNLPMTVRKVTITAEVNHVPIVTVEQVPTKEQAKELELALERIDFELHEKQRALVGE